MDQIEKQSNPLRTAVIAVLLLVAAALAWGSVSLVLRERRKWTADSPPLPVTGAQPVGWSACAGLLGEVVIENGLVIQPNTACTLEGTQVRGDIWVGNNAVLLANGVSVTGSIRAEGAEQVEVVLESTVEGSIHILRSGTARIIGADIGGDLFFTGNSFRLEAFGNQIRGNLQAVQNRGGMVITANTIERDLLCRENVRAPELIGNTVRGSVLDQCAELP